MPSDGIRSIIYEVVLQKINLKSDQNFRSNLQEETVREEHMKPHKMDLISMIQTLGNSRKQSSFKNN